MEVNLRQCAGWLAGLGETEAEYWDWLTGDPTPASSTTLQYPGMPPFSTGSGETAYEGSALPGGTIDYRSGEAGLNLATVLSQIAAGAKVALTPQQKVAVTSAMKPNTGGMAPIIPGLSNSTLLLIGGGFLVLMMLGKKR